MNQTYSNSPIQLLEELRDSLGHVLPSYLDNEQTEIEFILGLFEAFCLDAAARYVARGYLNIRGLSQNTIQELEQGLHALLRSSRDQPRSTDSVSTNESQSQRERNPGTSSPPDDYDPETMPKEDECPICYRRRATKGFTRCQHKVCPHCLDGLLNGSPAISCPMCRQGEPKDVDMREVSRRMEQISPYEQEFRYVTYAYPEHQPRAYTGSRPRRHRHVYGMPPSALSDDLEIYYGPPIYHQAPDTDFSRPHPPSQSLPPPTPPAISYDYHNPHRSLPPPFFGDGRYGHSPMNQEFDFEEMRDNIRRAFEAARETFPRQDYGHEDTRRDNRRTREDFHFRGYSRHDGNESDHEGRRRRRQRGGSRY